MAPNVSTAANQLLSGELSASPIAGPDKDRIDAAKFDSSSAHFPAGQMYFNQIADNPTSDPAVRKALVQAVNLDDLAEVITGGQGTRATSLVSVEPRACVYDSVAGNIPDFDLSAAKATLDAAGWTAGSDGKRSKDGKPLTLPPLLRCRRRCAQRGSRAHPVGMVRPRCDRRGDRSRPDQGCRRHAQWQGQQPVGHRVDPDQQFGSQRVRPRSSPVLLRQQVRILFDQQPRLRSSRCQGIRLDRRSSVRGVGGRRVTDHQNGVRSPVCRYGLELLLQQGRTRIR